MESEFIAIVVEFVATLIVWKKRMQFYCVKKLQATKKFKYTIGLKVFMRMRGRFSESGAVAPATVLR